ncbi:hypothetical protein Q5741_04235 [Paenibacillus sp. JX-17]|uniref:Uncharacterized protein n=1 Tax=Paenibacillus lacisoli TaxID=3064525 RepID=A0ABT9CAE0_9BACL|nr:hypothetical protein [Paenibacillus sp. JX-17]MDO7905619.1 hypothetical protein [Paenibacillus sp. JX-17]
MLVNGKKRGGLIYIHISSGFSKVGDYREEYTVRAGDRLMSRLTRRIYEVQSCKTVPDGMIQLELFDEKSSGVL